MRSHLSAGQFTCQWQTNKKKTLLAIVVAALPSYCCCASFCCCFLVLLLLLLLFSQQAFRLLLSVGSVRLWFLAAFVILSLTAGKSFCMYFWNAFKMLRPPLTRPLSTQPLAAHVSVDLMLRFHTPNALNVLCLSLIWQLYRHLHTHTHTQRHF